MYIIDGVYRLDHSRFSRIYYIPEKAILIDTGLPFQSGKIMKEIKTLGDSIKAVLLTHHDVDHAGNIRYIQKQTQASAWIGRENLPFLMGNRRRPGKKHIFETLLQVKPPLSCSAFPETGVDLFEDISIFSTPGHTPGHHIFCYKKVLFTGDLFRERKRRLLEMSATMNWNNKKAKQSIVLLKTLDFEIACPSHGDPIKKDPLLLQFIEGIGYE